MEDNIKTDIREEVGVLFKDAVSFWDYREMMEWCWQREPKYSGRGQFPCHFVHPKSHKYWPGDQPGDVRNIGLGDVEWTDVGHDRNRWQVIVNLVVEFCFHKGQIILWLAERILASEGLCPVVIFCLKSCFTYTNLLLTSVNMKS
jgi:hypothetical protein